MITEYTVKRFGDQQMKDNDLSLSKGERNEYC